MSGLTDEDGDGQADDLRAGGTATDTLNLELGYDLECAVINTGTAADFATSEEPRHNIICEEDATPPGSRLLVETVLGAPLILALAMKGIWSLHAGAIFEDNRLILFAGESGRGKSTLARSLAEDPDHSWLRAVDDVLPIALEPDGLIGLPHFPQLKLSTDEQLKPTIPGNLPIQAIYVLEDAAPDEPVATHQLNERDALLVLVKHTVASRLFDSSTLTRHLAFCAEAARQVPISRLVYPHRQGAVAEVAAQIDRYRQS